MPKWQLEYISAFLFVSASRVLSPKPGPNSFCYAINYCILELSATAHSSLLLGKGYNPLPLCEAKPNRVSNQNKIRVLSPDSR